MGKSLVLAEKPSVAKDIARVLGCKGGAGFMEGSKYVVTWALGHLVTLADPDHYNPQYKNWDLNVLPIIPKKMELVVIKETSRQYGIVKSLLTRGDITDIIIATDAGREGELVARWILEKSGVKKPVKRLWVSSVTDKAIKDGFNNLKDGKLYVDLYNSAKSRAEADWLVGINATRALTTKFNAQLSCGRVQTPTLAIIDAVEESIRTFRPQKFYGIEAAAEGISFTWQEQKSKSYRTFDKEFGDKVLADLNGKNIEIKEIEKQVKKVYPPKLYDLTELQRDANKRFGFSAKETLSIMQQLYERHKVLTYPRTDSRYLTTDIVGTLGDRLKAISVGDYGKLANRVNRSQIKLGSNFVDNSKVSDHHAIIPTEQSVSLEKLNSNERKVYDLVVRRFLTMFFPPSEYEEMTIKAVIGKEIFLARGKKMLVKGFKEVSDYSETVETDAASDLKDQTIKDIKRGTFKVTGLKQTTGQTTPPKPLNEATLLTAMESPSKYMKNLSKEHTATLNETGGLGTVATRADIIEKLFDSFMMEKRGKDIFLTSKGRQVLKLVPQDLKKPELTAVWEQQLTKIAKGQQTKDKFVGEIITYTQKIIGEIKASSEQYKHDNMTFNKCPDCGKNMLEVKGKKGLMHVCQDRDCGFRKTVTVMTNARCPQCHKRMELVGDGDNRKFVCLCGFREKMAAFEERQKTQANQVSKNEVGKFLKEQQHVDVKNNALSEALKGFKFD